LPEVEKNKSEVRKSDHAGTISVSGYMDGTVDYLKDSILSVLESYYYEYPQQRTFLKPVIEKTKETIEFMVENNRKLISTRESDLALYEKETEEYEKLISKETVAEQEVQDFFEKHPTIIDARIVKLIPKVSFGGERYPDFAAVLINGSHILIEIEKPQDKIYKNNGDPTSEFSHAEQQIEYYLQWLYDEPDYLRRRELPKISVENTTGLIIIGMSKSLTPEEKKKFEMHNFSARSSHETKTFDQILAEKKHLLRCLRERIENAV
jgi:hypothetical protein